MAADRAVKVLGAGNDGAGGRVELHFAVDGRIGHQRLGALAGVAHLGDGLALAGALRGIAQERDLRVHAEYAGALDGLAGDLHQLVLAGIDVDGAVRHGQNLVLAGGGAADQDEAGRDDVVARLRLDQLQRRTDGIRGGIGRAAQQAVGNAHMNQHGTEIVGLLQRGAALFLGHLALAQRHHLLDHLLHALIGLRIDDPRAADIEAGFLGGGLDLLLVADQDGFQEGCRQQAGPGLKDARVRTLREYDGLGVLFQRCDQRFKHSGSSDQHI